MGVLPASAACSFGRGVSRSEEIADDQRRFAATGRRDGMQRRRLLRRLAPVAAVGLAGCSGGGAARRGTIESLSLDLALNDEFADDYPDAGNGTVTCTSVGPPADTVQVRLDATVADNGEGGSEPAVYVVAVRVGDREGTTDVRVPSGGRESVRTLLLIEDDETVTAGETATVSVALRREGETDDSTTRTVPVTARDQRCVDGG
jgi:hypothetical protein